MFSNLFKKFKQLFKNKLMFINLNAYQIYTNLLVMAISFIFLSGWYLVITIVVSIVTLFPSIYMLRWSFKNKTYYTESLFQREISTAIRKSLPYILGCLLKSLLYLVPYLVIYITAVFFIDIDPLKYEEKKNFFDVMRISTYVSCGILIFFYFFYSYYELSTFNTDMYERVIAQLVSDFNLNLNESVFFIADYGVAGFISSHFTKIEEYIYYKDIIMNERSIRRYLKYTGLSLAELDSDHLKLIEMYNY